MNTAWKNALLLLVSLAFAVVALELGLRLVMGRLSDQPDPVASERHIYDPFRGHALNPVFNTKTNTLGQLIHSPDGFRRDTPVSREKPDNVIRIVMFGGSALYGIGTVGSHYPYAPDLMNDETIPHHLERLLNARLATQGLPQRVEVLNAGLIGYHTWQHLVHLNSKLLEYQPDIVINFDGHNDFYLVNPARRPWYDYQYSSVQLTKAINNREPIVGVHFLVRALAPHSAIFAQLEKRVTKPRFEAHLDSLFTERQPEPPLEGTLEEQFRATARSGFMRALWQINRLGAYEGYDHLVFLQPEILFEDPADLGPHDREIREITARYTENEAAMRQIRPLLPELFAEAGIPFADVGDIARQAGTTEPLYMDYCHLLPRGSEAVAERLVDPVYTAVQRRFSSPQHTETTQ